MRNRGEERSKGDEKEEKEREVKRGINETK